MIALTLHLLRVAFVPGVYLLGDLVVVKRRFGEEYNALIRRATQAVKFQDSVQIPRGTLR